MNKKALASFTGIFLFLFILNYLTPMCFGDDYLYSFIWQGQPMFVPLGENASRVASWHDLFISQRSHYLTWGGRTVAHVLAQLFLWMGKDVFNFFNAFIGTLLVAEIYWCIHHGNVSLNFKPGAVCWIFFVLWAFTTGFSTVFFWLTAACNYLWTTVILLGFVIPYIQRYYHMDISPDNGKKYSPIGMFVFGIVAGWTNENSVCWIVLLLLLFLFVYCKNHKIDIWMYAGVAGLMIGYALLMFSPGNMARLLAEQKGANWVTIDAMTKHFSMLAMIVLFQIFLWFFCLRAFLTLRHMNLRQEEIKIELLLAQVLCIVAFGMTVIMLCSPKFPPRSSFPGTVHLIIATGILLRLQGEHEITLIKSNAAKFLFYIGCLYFLMTATVTIHDFNKMNLQVRQILVSAQRMHLENKNDILKVNRIITSDNKKDLLSGFHTVVYELAEDENDWTNVAFARYYGIKGIRMMKEKVQP